MQWTIPGTVLQIPIENAEHIDEIFASMFLPGDIVLSQITGITGLEDHTVQNWVKRGFLTRPVRKRYTKRQLCRILNINMLKSALPLESVCTLLGYINGALDSEADDIIDDTALYFLFVRLAAQAPLLDDASAREQAVQQALSGYQEPVAGAKTRLSKALQIMLTAWIASKMRAEAEEKLLALDEI